FDWNSFGPVTWTGTAPHLTTSKAMPPWQFLGLTDPANSQTDNVIQNGMKQDDNCPGVVQQKPSSKTDLLRAYFAYRTGTNGHLYVMLAWELIPQGNKEGSQPSATVAFEFNQGTTPCDANPAPGVTGGGLVNRRPGDVLITYDFGSGQPVLTARRWQS